MKIAAFLALLSALALAAPAIAAPVTVEQLESARSKELVARNNPVLLGALTGAGLATVVGGLVGGPIDHRDLDHLRADVHLKASAAAGISHSPSTNIDRKHAGPRPNHRSIIPRAPQTKTPHSSGNVMPWATGYTPGLNLWPAPASKKGGK
ncbi:hypothetical protein B0A48_17824 [Cryoendolithus antarcticus]|uniref:Uncharacterized protein n=1 Tax=Cryoendolithus antarcticus TaxID=1507870 RepID=A0A1V8SAX1_9PEZI|nr:hypothetical protein B0A48_17824 [Cryoendolithus antarcticus]